MRLIVFDVAGYIAHFRKYFSTTSALSYAFPPRTTISGMIAGILGYERDGYYELLSSENCKIGLQIRKPIRRIVQMVNYLMTDKEAMDAWYKKLLRRPLTNRQLVSISQPAQVHAELVVADGQYLSELCYRVFFSHDDEALMKNLKNRLIERRFCYPPSLGAANNIATIDYIQTMEAEVFHPKEEVEVSTVTPTSIVKSISPQEGLRIYIEELVPADFSPDRILRRRESYIYEGSGKPVKLRIEGEVFRCSVKGGRVVGVFM